MELLLLRREGGHLGEDEEAAVVVMSGDVTRSHLELGAEGWMLEFVEIRKVAEHQAGVDRSNSWDSHS